MSITIGVDIGGSHVACAAVNMKSMRVIPKSFFYEKVNNKSSKEEILDRWACAINNCLQSVANEEVTGIGFAMPGPFNYKDGLALFERNNKYESLYGVSVVDELPVYLKRKDLPIKFINDASAFGVSASIGKDGIISGKILALTLGTGFGAAFIEDQVALFNGNGVPNEGCLWDKPFLNSIADDYFSTRWFVNKYKEYSKGNVLSGVKEIVEKNDTVSKEIFKEFSQNLSAFLMPFINDFKCSSIVIGGSISKAQNYFLNEIVDYWKNNGLEMKVVVLSNTEEENIIGASYLFKDNYWEKLQDNLFIEN